MKRNRHSICFAVVFLGTFLVPSSGRISAQSVPAFRLYPGPERPADQVAILSVSRIPISAVNGGEIGKEAPIALLPGRHTLTLMEGSTGIVRCFDAEAGHSYQVRILSGERIIVDLATMEPVGEILPAPIRDTGGNHRLLNKDGNWRYIIPMLFSIGTLLNNRIYVDAFYLDEFGKDLTEKFRWWLNVLGFTLIDGYDSGKVVPNQHTQMHFEGRQNPMDAEMFIGEDAPVIRYGQRLFAPYPLLKNELLELITMSPSQFKEISGLAQKIARGCHEKGVTRVLKSIFCFTHADGGDFFAVLTVRDRDNNKQILTFSEKE